MPQDETPLTARLQASRQLTEVPHGYILMPEDWAALAQLEIDSLAYRALLKSPRAAMIAGAICDSMENKKCQT